MTRAEIILNALGGALFGTTIGILCWSTWGPRWLLWDLITSTIK